MESSLRCAAGASDLKLIETMYWDGRSIPRLDLHLARLSAGMAALGWQAPCTAEECLGELAMPPDPARLRLTMSQDGAIEIAVSDMPPAKAVWHIGLAAARLWSDDPWLRVKSTRRAAYDEAREKLPSGLDEVIFLNERDEVCDGTITTVFFDRGEGLRTPPLTCGLLPGVLRAEIGCKEEVLCGKDLPYVDLWVGNALRGLCPALWRG